MLIGLKTVNVLLLFDLTWVADCAPRSWTGLISNAWPTFNYLTVFQACLHPLVGNLKKRFCMLIIPKHESAKEIRWPLLRTVYQPIISASFTFPFLILMSWPSRVLSPSQCPLLEGGSAVTCVPEHDRLCTQKYVGWAHWSPWKLWRKERRRWQGGTCCWVALPLDNAWHQDKLVDFSSIGNRGDRTTWVSPTF